MRGSNFTLGLMLAILFLPAFFFRTSGDPMKRKRRTSNLIGLVVLAAFVVAIIVAQSIGAIKEKAKIKDTKVTLNEVADGFAHSDQDVMMKWAKGDYQDAWGNQVVIGENSDDVWFASKGTDGELGTEDDVVSEVFAYVPEKVDLTPIVVEPEKKSLMEKAKGLFRKD